MPRPTVLTQACLIAYVDDDYPPQLPLRLPPAGLVLEDGYPHFALRADDEWGTLFPKSGGFTDLGPHNRTFLLSFMHQIHCLDVIRVAYVTNRTTLVHGVEHCLRYLRQMVLCNADTTLEPTEIGLFNGNWEPGASGVGSVHRCKDWTVLRRYMDDHPAGPAIAPGSQSAASSDPSPSG